MIKIKAYLKKNFKMKSLIALTFLSGTIFCQSMDTPPAPQKAAPQTECILPIRNLKEGEIPSGYVHCNVSQQMTYYREKAYDAALKMYNGNVEDLKTKPIPGLFVILENAFALVHDYIAQDNSNDQDFKNKYFKELRDIWEKAKSFESGMTSSIFQAFNKNIAYIIDCYKGSKDVDLAIIMASNPLSYPNWIEFINHKIEIFREEIAKNQDKEGEATDKLTNKYLDKLSSIIEDNILNEIFLSYGFSAINQLFEKIREAYELNNLEKMKNIYIRLGSLSIPNINDIIFIIYGNPNPKILGRNISPIHFVEQFCNNNYTAYIAFLDILSNVKEATKKDPHWSLENGTGKMLSHDFNHIRAQIRSLKNKEKEYIRSAYEIQKKYRMNGNNNEATILIDGLFMIIHERPDSAQIKSDNLNTFFEATTKGLKQKIMTFKAQNALNKHGSDKYKQENRDWEYILRDKYLDKNDNLMKPLHDKEGQTFLPIEYDSIKKKMTRPFPHLEKGSEERKNEMEKALESGYARFWDYFLYLIKNPPAVSSSQN